MRRSKIVFCLAFLLSLLLVFASCGSNNYAGGDYAKGEAAGDSMTNTGTVLEDAALSSSRKIIKTARMSVETSSYDSFLEQLSAATQSVGGFYASASYSGSAAEYSRVATVSLRIPAASFDAFRASLDGMGTVTSYNESIDDVTMHYVDVESRIAVLEAEEKALLAMLEKTETINDALLVRQQLSGVQQDLASLRGQKASYDDLIAYSTLYINITEVERESLSAEDHGFFAELGDTFVKNVRGVVRFFRALVIWLLGNSVTFLLIAAVVSGIAFAVRAIVKRAKRRRKKNNNIS